MGQAKGRNAGVKRPLTKRTRKIGEIEGRRGKRNFLRETREKGDLTIESSHNGGTEITPQNPARRTYAGCRSPTQRGGKRAKYGKKRKSELMQALAGNHEDIKKKAWARSTASLTWMKGKKVEKKGEKRGFAPLARAGHREGRKKLD